MTRGFPEAGSPCVVHRGLFGEDSGTGSSMSERVLALDVDGVLLDADRGGDGDWTNELERRFGITRPQIRAAFFAERWEDVVNGRRPLEGALQEALTQLGVDTGVEEVIACWFDADYVPFEPALDLARRASAAGIRVVLATNQEHRRARYLRERLEGHFPLDDVLYSADLGIQKHDPRFFAAATARLEVDDVSRIVFVDDVEHNVAQARAAGWTAFVALPDQAWVSEVENLFCRSAIVGFEVPQ